MMYEAVRKQGIPCSILVVPGEGHIFQKAENQRRALEVEFYFYSKVFGFECADAIEPVDIQNLTG